LSPQFNREGEAGTPATLRKGTAWLQAAVEVTVGRRQRELGGRPRGEWALEISLWWQIDK